MLPEAPMSEPDLMPYIEAAGENDNVDAKRAMTWDGAEKSASLAKDIMAFNNSRDGGAIVIGKWERTPGKFVLEGVSPDQAQSFDTTKVATWVNNRCAPPVRLVCYGPERGGKLFVVILVKEFDDAPVICTKDELSKNTKKRLLKKGTIYVRNANAESAPLSTLEELRGLIGIATAKRGDQILAMFRSMLEGQPLLAGPARNDGYKDELTDLGSLLENELGREESSGSWSLRFHPLSYSPQRWTDDELEAQVSKNSFKVRYLGFPRSECDIDFQTRGICYSISGHSAFAMNRSGLFILRYTYRENSRTFASPWAARPDLAAGRWMDFEWNLGFIIQSFWFMFRVAHDYDPGEQMVYHLEATGLRGRKLVSLNPAIAMDESKECKALEYREDRTVKVEEIRTAWERLCLGALQGFFRLFVGKTIRAETLMDWIEKFKNPGL